ncbi:MAG: hypothetical protein KBA46_03300 [Candidatus Omnitrophica bacterium]|nr:hypothetical protein [Candidatus Omnitrophota bacterium]
MNIFVGNLSFESTESDVKKLFEGFGNVTSVAIVMDKSKHPKSRGFGFVEMPDQEQALSAIASLHDKEFMGRVLNVSPARPKTEAEREKEAKKKVRAQAVLAAGKRPGVVKEQKRAWNNSVSNKPGTYRGGRRTLSYVKRQVSAGPPQEVKPWRRSHDNPMRWRKRSNQSRPWQKPEGDVKPWVEAKTGNRPWDKPRGESKPLAMPGAGHKRSARSRSKSQRSPRSYTS